MQLINAHVHITGDEAARVVEGEEGQSPLLVFGHLVFGASDVEAAKKFAEAAQALADAFRGGQA